ncbi:MAG: threonylcarbamoyl-AMP synthase [Oscillospiraceae bacterium]|nr:threonylcarbamoyl-AMP synthase [Oscillospiraceae bacterium]
MQTKIFTEENIEEAGEIIRNGGLVAFPTETVYGLGASAFNPDAASKIYEAKGRPSDNPLIVHISDKALIGKLALEITSRAKKLIDSFMPGPFTIILKKSDNIPDAVTAGLDTVGIRLPSNETAVRFIAAAGVPIAAPSANISGKPSPTRVDHVIQDMSGKIDGIIDGGECSVGVESTIIDASGERPVLLRPGGITLEMLREIVPETMPDEHIFKSVSADERPLCPGMKYKHYAPNAEVIVVEGEKDAVQAKIRALLKENRGRITGVLTMYGSAYDEAVILSAGDSDRSYAKKLFAALREFDALGVELVFAEFCEKDGYGAAVKNRLYKSAGNNVIHV